MQAPGRLATEVTRDDETTGPGCMPATRRAYAHPTSHQQAPLFPIAALKRLRDSKVMHRDVV
jgi:hypothetical protein